MKQRGLYALAGLVLLLANTVFFPLLGLQRWQPDLFLIAVAAVAFRRGSEHGELVGFGAGLLQDLFSATTLGVHAFTKTLVAFIVGRCSRFLYQGSAWVFALIVFISSWVENFCVMILSLGFSTGAANWWWQQPFSNAVVAFFLMTGFQFYHRHQRRSRFL